MNAYHGTRSRSWFAGRVGGALVASLSATVIVTAVACSDSAAIVGPQAVVGPESLTVQLTISPTTFTSGQTATLRATARNKSGALVIARFAAPACGLQVIVEHADGTPGVTVGQACSPSAGEVRDTLPPSDSIVVAPGIGNLPPGVYRAYAVFHAVNGNAPNSVPTIITVQ